MLFPHELTGYANDLVGLIDELEEFVISDVSRRIAKQVETYGNASLSQTAVYQLQALEESGVMMADIQKQIAATNRMALSEVERMFQEANETSFGREALIALAAGCTLVMSAAKKQIVENTTKDTSRIFLNLTGSVGLAGQPLEKFYQSTLNKAFVEVATGASDYQSAVKRAVKGLSDSGLQYVSYGKRNDHLDVAARRALITGLKDTTNAISEMNAQELGCDGWEVSAHRGARPTHAEWQGGQYARSRGDSKGYPAYDDVVGDEMDDPNCRHTKWGIFLGQEPLYSKEQLEQLDGEFEFDGKTYSTYEATQKQRMLERKMRQTKREIAAGKAAGLDTTALQIKLKSQSRLYSDFSKAAGLLEQRERTGVATKNILLSSPKGVIIPLDSKGREAFSIMDYENIKNLRVSDLAARQWYIEHSEKIPTLVDKTLPLEQQAKQAHALRNQYKVQSREIMADTGHREFLDNNFPIDTFEERFNALTTKDGMTAKEAYEKIIDSAPRTNKGVNEYFGLD